ncbi:hypothetical protein [Luteimicrobium sp. DT211]|uniref:hypothetical protein n=1 Tax=Luteimicrobium sp. DT211 TaxID=3393412 RepID=UPI003CED7622
MSGNDASIHHELPAGPEQDRPRWSRRLLGRLVTPSQAWRRLALYQIVVACWIFLTVDGTFQSPWTYALLVLAVLGEAEATWRVVDAYRYRR